MSVHDLEAAVTRLSAEEDVADQWDKKIEADILAGRFDAAGKRAEAEFEAGRCKPV